ncbi:MAG TPA: CRISPR-associated protein Cas4 [Solibacterales bacterium]|nr:CRISPR-associated protein Cas4 [Bryobacterales bacterium]
MATSSSEPSTRYREDELLPLSGLRHLAVCERQFALVHIEQSWADNFFTAEGALLHRSVDQPRFETRRGRRLVHALPLHSRCLGVSGRADLVEFPTEQGGDPPVPVEFKRGHPKDDDVDEVQVCAQAMCLEEMLGVVVPQGLIFYHQVRHRSPVPLSAALRSRVEALALQMHNLFRLGRTPVVNRMPKCSTCSLFDLCQPEWTSPKRKIWDNWRHMARNLLISE